MVNLYMSVDWLTDAYMPLGEGQHTHPASTYRPLGQIVFKGLKT